MKLTAELKQWLIDNCGVKADASDDECKKAAGEAFASGKLTANQYTELTKDKEDAEAEEFTKQFKSLADGIAALTEQLRTKEKTAEEKEAEEKAAKEVVDKEAADKVDKAAKEAADKSTPSAMSKLIAQFGGVDAEDPVIRVKEAAENYDHNTKTALIYPGQNKAGKVHPLAGQPVMYNEQPLDTNSVRDKAICGAYSKYMCAVATSNGSRTIAWSKMPQHDKELIYYAMEHMDWNGYNGDPNCNSDYANIKERRLTPNERKTIIDDAAGGSGGMEAAPIVFDADVIQVPLLNGELYPLVGKKPIAQGRRMEGVVIRTVTGGWGGIDATPIALFVTTNYVAAFNTTIWRWEGAITIGLDFLSDTPIDFGSIITEQYGQRLLTDLDNTIANGLGTNSPTGVMNTPAGLTTTAWAGATSLGNYESLMFGVDRAELGPGGKDPSAVFCGTWTSYQRAKAIPVAATDARRLSDTVSMPNYHDFSWMGQPYKINNAIGNTNIFYAIMRRYRMYVRRGLTIRTSTEGATLIRANEYLITATARYGGQMERGACASVTTTAPA